jgi:glycosyltransferase involved in cell wall biosynthesis
MFVTHTARQLRLLHAIHDFLPRHHAGSELYALDLSRELNRSHHVTVLAAEYDPARAHGHVTWRVQDGIPVAELVNNWIAGSFAETYRSPVITEQLGRLLDVVQPDILHVHSLLNLSFDLPTLAHARAIPVVATLHDYTLVCASGGQRVHRAEDHLCETIDSERCARCFRESPFYPQIAAGNIAHVTGLGRTLKDAAGVLARRAPRLTRSVANAAAQSAAVQVTTSDIDTRLNRARAVFEEIDLFVAPSRSIADEFERLGLRRSKIRVSDYGFLPFDPVNERPVSGPLRIGFVGTLVSHKGAHILIDAVRALPSRAYELKIFGDEHVFPDYSAQLRNDATGLPVRFEGAFDRDRTAEVFGSIDVLVVPSIWLENSPLVIHEAFMAGVPVVAARIGGIADLVTDETNGLLYEPRSTAALTRALKRLIDDPQLLDAFSRNLPAVKSMEAHAKEWEGIYSDLLQRP